MPVTTLAIRYIAGITTGTTPRTASAATAVRKMTATATANTRVDRSVYSIDMCCDGQGGRVRCAHHAPPQPRSDRVSPRPGSARRVLTGRDARAGRPLAIRRLAVPRHRPGRLRRAHSRYPDRPEESGGAVCRSRDRRHLEIDEQGRHLDTDLRA